MRKPNLSLKLPSQAQAKPSPQPSTASHPTNGKSADRSAPPDDQDTLKQETLDKFDFPGKHLPFEEKKTAFAAYIKQAFLNGKITGAPLHVETSWLEGQGISFHLICTPTDGPSFHVKFPLPNSHMDSRYASKLGDVLVSRILMELNCAPEVFSTALENAKGEKPLDNLLTITRDLSIPQQQKTFFPFQQIKHRFTQSTPITPLTLPESAVFDVNGKVIEVKDSAKLKAELLRCEVIRLALGLRDTKREGNTGLQFSVEGADCVSAAPKLVDFQCPVISDELGGSVDWYLETFWKNANSIGNQLVNMKFAGIHFTATSDEIYAELMKLNSANHEQRAPLKDIVRNICQDIGEYTNEKEEAAYAQRLQEIIFEHVDAFEATLKNRLSELEKRVADQLPAAPLVPWLRLLEKNSSSASLSSGAGSLSSIDTNLHSPAESRTPRFSTPLSPTQSAISPYAGRILSGNSDPFRYQKPATPTAQSPRSP